MLPATFMFFSGSSALRYHPSMPTTLTCCHGDEDVYFALSFIKAYHPDMLSWWSGRLLRPHFHQGLHSDILPWWWGRLLCPHFHQGLASYHPVMLLWWWYHQHRTLPWTSTRLSPWHVVMVIRWYMSPSFHQGWQPWPVAMVKWSPTLDTLPSIGLLCKAYAMWWWQNCCVYTL